MTALHTMDETATKLRISRRSLQDFIRDYPYYRSFGRKKLFTDEDVARLIEALPCPGNSSRPARAKRRSGTSGGNTSASLLTEVRALARGEPPLRSSTPGNDKRSVVSFPNSGTRRRPGVVLQRGKSLHAGRRRAAICRGYLQQMERQLLSDIDQVAIDTLASELYPASPASTRNRQVYTPVSAILKHVGIDKKIKRPKGWRGSKRTFWLKPEQTFALLDEASKIDAEFGIFCTLLNYTGLRLSEGLGLQCEQVDLQREYAYVPDTKTGEPRAVYLPPVVVASLAGHPRTLAPEWATVPFP